KRVAYPSKYCRTGSRKRIPPDRGPDGVVVGLGRTTEAREHLPFIEGVLSAPNHAAVIALVEVLPEARRGLPQTPVVCGAPSCSSTGGEARLGGDQATQVAEVRIAKTERRDANIEESGAELFIAAVRIDIQAFPGMAHGPDQGHQPSERS